MDKKKDLDNMIHFFSILMIIYGSCVILGWTFYVISGLIRYFTFPYSSDIWRKVIIFLSQVVIKFGYYIYCGILGRRVVKHKVKIKTVIMFLVIFLLLDLIIALFEFRWTIILECILPFLLIYILNKTKIYFEI